MNRKSVFLLALLCALSLSAQAIPPVRVTRAVTRAANTIAARSARVNRKAISRLKQFTKLSDRPIQTVPERANLVRLRNSVFELQISTDGRHSASAFALNVNGRTWGVTAAHVMENIRSNPFAKVRTENGNILAPISFFRVGRKQGGDVAIFEIPQEILPHVEVLSPAENLPAMGTLTESPTFIKENYVLLPTEDILFAGQHRILLRDRFIDDITGFCGSPILADGKVVGLHIGAYPLQHIERATWNSLFHANNLSLKTPLHVASPIEHALQLIEQTTAQKPVGTQIKVLGHPVYLLTPQESLSSLTLMRNGFVKKEIHAHPFMNFEHLEEFFDLEENDVLRITIVSPRPYSTKMVTKIFDVNVSTGKVISLVR